MTTDSEPQHLRSILAILKWPPSRATWVRVFLIAMTLFAMHVVTSKLQSISGNVLWLPSDYRELAKTFAVAIASCFALITWKLLIASEKSRKNKANQVGKWWKRFISPPFLETSLAAVFLICAVMVWIPYKDLASGSVVEFTVNDRSASGEDVVSLEKGKRLTNYLFLRDEDVGKYQLLRPKDWPDYVEEDWYVRGVIEGVSPSSRAEAVERGFNAILQRDPLTVLELYDAHSSLRLSAEARGHPLLLLHLLILSLAGVGFGCVLGPLDSILESWNTHTGAA